MSGRDVHGVPVRVWSYWLRCERTLANHYRNIWENLILFLSYFSWQTVLPAVAIQQSSDPSGDAALRFPLQEWGDDVGRAVEHDRGVLVGTQFEQRPRGTATAAKPGSWTEFRRFDAVPPEAAIRRGR